MIVFLLKFAFTPFTFQKSLKPSPFGVKNFGAPITAIVWLTVPQPFLSMINTS